MAKVNGLRHRVIFKEKPLPARLMFGAIARDLFG